MADKIPERAVRFEREDGSLVAEFLNSDPLPEPGTFILITRPGAGAERYRIVRKHGESKLVLKDAAVDAGTERQIVEYMSRAMAAGEIGTAVSVDALRQAGLNE